MQEELKKNAAKKAMSELGSGMRIGLGTGSTAKHFVDLLGVEVSNGFDCLCVPTSEATAIHAQSLKIPLTTLDDINWLDVTVDGADEIDDRLQLIKGGGGALLREKIVAAASKKMIVIADVSKRVPALGAFPLPIEVVRFGVGATRKRILEIMDKSGAGTRIDMRTTKKNTPFVTDEGHYILDAFFGRISDAKAVSDALLNVPGVVQHGLFVDLCAKAYLAGPDSVLIIE